MSSVKPRKMTTPKRLGAYLLSYLIIVIVLFLSTNFWQSLDYFIYKTFYFPDSGDINMRADIEIIDLPYTIEGKTFDRSNYRKRIIDLLKEIEKRHNNNERSKAIILDIYFSSDPAEMDSLKAVLGRLYDAGAKVYAVYDTQNHDTKLFENHDSQQAVELYEEYFYGYRTHSLIDYKKGVLMYDSDVSFAREAGGKQRIEALTVRVAKDQEKNDSFTANKKTYILPIGNEKSLKTYSFTHEGSQTSNGKFSSEVDFHDKFVIIGSLKQDQLVGLNKTGTKVLAWALYDQLEDNQLAKQPVTNASVIIGVLLFFSFFTVFLFGIFFKYIKRLQMQPTLLAVLTFASSLVLLILFGITILALDKVLPVGLTVLAMIVATVLTWRFANKYLVTGIAEGVNKYDVFISYSHGNSKWVKENVYKPLSAFTKPDGKKLEIFFDENSIGIGEAFTLKYMRGIVDSKCFVPIMSDEYYSKNHCKNEMDLAFKRYVEELIDIHPIAFSFECIPDIYTHINTEITENNSNFLDKLYAKLSK